MGRDPLHDEGAGRVGPVPRGIGDLQQLLRRGPRGRAEDAGAGEIGHAGHRQDKGNRAEEQVTEEEGQVGEGPGEGGGQRRRRAQDSVLVDGVTVGFHHS